jgi:hypothetical protein
MAAGANRLCVLAGGARNPLREGVCRRAGCADPAAELGLCQEHLQGYNRMRGRREQVLALRAAANYAALAEAAVSEPVREGEPAVEREWLWALGEHLAAHGIDAGTRHDEDLLEGALLDALGDYVDERAGRGPLRVVA